MSMLLLSIPGLSRELLAFIPTGSRLGDLVARGVIASLLPSWPAVTCSVQATLTTGASPSVHGVVANGVATYRSQADARLVDAANHGDYRCEVSFWEQSNQFVGVPRFWRGDGGSQKPVRTAMLFFQHCMPGFSGTPAPAADIVLTPKPEHGPDGRTTSLLWSSPPGLAGELQKDLGPFPLMNYWGPMAGIRSSAWIAAAAERVLSRREAELVLTYVPHLDYDLQRFGPGSESAKAAVAELSGALEGLLETADGLGTEVVVLSEYAISEVSRAIAPNRALRDAGLLKLRRNAEGPQVDYAGSPGFVMCDHQIGHVYLRSEGDRAAVEGVVRELGLEVMGERGIAHPRGGDIQVQAPEGAWLDYRWWAEGATAETDPEVVPKWASTIDIHRKPGYDPLELFFGGKPSPPPAPLPPIAWKSAMIKGSHGRSGVNGVLILPARFGVKPGEAVRAEDFVGKVWAGK